MLQSLSPVLALHDPFGVGVPLNYDTTTTYPSVKLVLLLNCQITWYMKFWLEATIFQSSHFFKGMGPYREKFQNANCAAIILFQPNFS